MSAVSRPKALLLYLTLITISVGISISLYGNADGSTKPLVTGESFKSESSTVPASESDGKNDKKSDVKAEEKADGKITSQNITTRENTTQKNAGNVSGSLRVQGTKLVDSRGKTVQLRGLSTHGIAWYPEYINNGFFAELRTKWNANVVRLAMYTAESGGYCTGGSKTNLKKLIDNGVKYATDNGLYVIIDWHILSDGNPNTHITEAKEFFAEMSKKYASHSNVIYEICNEPNGGTSWQEIKSYAETVIGVIRQNDSDAIVLVGTPNWSQYITEAAADPITKYNNIMYTLHFYAATHTDSLRNNMISAIKSGLPVFVSEFGICDASGSGAINETQAAKWLDVMNQYNISFVAWNISNKSETSAIFKSSCVKTSGFTENDLSASGKWIYKALTGKTVLKANSDVSSANIVTTASAVTTTQAPKGTFGIPAYTARTVNSWESNGQTFYQYELTLKNDSNQNFSSWSVEIPFNEQLELVNSWNGTFTLSGNTLKITSADYNGTVNAGESISNIGFIVSGSKNLKLR